MCWESIIAIATVATALVAFGVPFMIEALSKPSVPMPDILQKEWQYDYICQTTITGTVAIVYGLFIRLHVNLVNNGGTKTNIKVWFKSIDGKIFSYELPIGIDGYGACLNNFEIILKYPTQTEFPDRGSTIKGFITFEPWRNRRFLLGKKYLTKFVEIHDGTRSDLDPIVIKKIQELKNDTANRTSRRTSLYRARADNL